MKKAGREEIKTFIKERLAELLNIEPQSIDENAFLVEDLGTTSIMISWIFWLLLKKSTESICRADSIWSNPYR